MTTTTTNNPRVIIADDEPTTLRLLELCVRKAGCECTLFADGLDVVKNASEVEPDLAILDYQLPGRNGLELIGDFKSDERLAGMPIIVVTGYRELALKQSLLSAGADEVILKPFSPQLLGRKVAEIVGKKERVTSEVSSEDRCAAIGES